MTSRLTTIVVDGADTERLAEFWGAVLGWQVVDRDDDEHLVEIGPGDGSSTTILFERVPEAKSVKNRLHLDVNAVGVPQAEEVERILALGATRADVGQGEQTWVVLADPEGNEFCVLQTTVDEDGAPV